MEKWLSIIGSIVSIGSAIWAFYEAKQASESASKAKVVRDEMIQRRKMMEASQVHFETNRILRVVSKVGPSCNETLLRGVNCSDIAKEVEEYSRFINEQSSHFTNFFENQANELCNALKDGIEALAEAKTYEEKKLAGKNIYHNIYNFMPTAKQLSDEKRERAIEIVERK